MPLPNRVTPFGDLEAAPQRGLLFGNRGGRFHDAGSQSILGRPWVNRQWISCTLDFKHRAHAFRAAGRSVWEGSRYTELFFCDEVTALAAGHRPCMECRRTANLSYRDAAVRGGAFSVRPSCPDLDCALDNERREGRMKRMHLLDAAGLPDGAMIDLDGQALALLGPAALVWSHAGYRSALPRPRGMVDVLTPPVSLAALAGGYLPLWHPSVGI
jgi:hypothetical protein